MIVNQIARCLLPSERRPLDLDAVRYLVVHRVSFAHAKVGEHEPVPDDELDGPAVAERDRALGEVTRCAYHFLIRQDGTIDQCLPLTQRGAHALSYNRRSIAVALAGDFQRQPPGASQLAALIQLGEALLPLCREMVGHDALPGATGDTRKVCPGMIALPLVQQSVASRLPLGWAEWLRPQCVEWAKGLGVVA